MKWNDFRLHHHSLLIRYIHLCLSSSIMLKWKDSHVFGISSWSVLLATPRALFSSATLFFSAESTTTSKTTPDLKTYFRGKGKQFTKHAVSRVLEKYASLNLMNNLIVFIVPQYRKRTVSRGILRKYQVSKYRNLDSQIFLSLDRE